MKLCKQCKTHCENEAKFCQECGYRFTEDDKPVKVCKNCNTPNPESSKFCQECGSRLDFVADVTNEDLKKDAKDKPISALEQFVDNKNDISLPDEENGSQTDTELITQPLTGADTVKESVSTLVEKVEIKKSNEDTEDKTEVLIEPDPDLRDVEKDNSSQSEEKPDEIPVQTEPVEVVEEPKEETEPEVSATVEEKPEPVVEKQSSNVSKLMDFDFERAKKEGTVDNNSVPVNESENGVQTDIDSTFTQNGANNRPTVTEIIANDPYYNDVPLGDKEEIEKPKVDKDTMKKVIALVVGALVFITAITVVLVVTS